MSSIDERIVEMEFKASSFTSGVNSVISALSKLKSSLNLSGAEQSLNKLDAAGKKFSLANLASSAESVASKFSALGILGVSALATIASKAVSAGLQLVKSFTIDPILQGLDVYQEKINATQTILANTEAAGTTLSQVTAALNNLSVYAQKTVYSFGDMTNAIGLFTSAGVGLKDSVESIKGIANLAALSGATSQQATSAMYQLSQAIAAGSVKLQDWNSVVNAGIGGKVFQNALVETAKAYGVNVDAMIKKAGSFRNSLDQGWLSSKILVTTLSEFTGDMTNAQLKSIGFSNQQIAAIQKLALTANNSATQVRTLSQLQQDLSEEVATAWSKIFDALFGNLTQATALFSNVHNVLENMFTGPLLQLASLLEQWNALGGRTYIIQGLANAFKAFEVIITAVKTAFTDIFPPATASELVSLSKDFDDFTQKLILSKSSAETLTNIFIGLFSAVKIVVDVVVDVVKGFTGIGSSASSAVGGVASIAARFADFLNHMLQVVESGGKVTSFFTDIGKVVSAPIKLIGDLIGGLSDLASIVDTVWKKIEPFAQEVGAEFSKLGDAIAQGISSGGFSNVINILNQGLFALVILQIKKFFTTLTSKVGEAGEKTSLIDTIKESFEGLTNTLKSMQQTLKSTILLEIAAAVGVLTASIVALSFINAGRLTQALTAITLMFTELLAGMAIVSKIAGTSGLVQMTVIAADLSLLATAILILAGAVALLSSFSWEGLGKGIAAIAAMLLELVVATKLMEGNSAGLIASAYSMEVMATALNIMAIAVRTLGALPIAQLAKGTVTIAALLLVVAGFQKLGGGENMIASAVAMVAIGAALNIIAIAMVKLGGESWDSIAKGLVSMAGSLVILSAATILMEGSLPGAAALLVASAALVILAQAMEGLGGMGWDAIAKSLVELAGSLVIIAAALIVMEASLPGAAALIVAAGALAILAPVLIALGQLSWTELLTSLAALAGVFVILGAAGLLLTPLVPTLLGLGVAITLIGVGVLAAGAGVALFAAGLAALGAAIVVVGGSITVFAEDMITLLPNVFTALAKSIVNFAVELGNGGTQIANAFLKLATALLNVIIQLTPKIGQAIQAILTTILNLINKNAGPIINTMSNLILKLLNAISSRAGQFATAGANAIVNVLNGIAKEVPRIATAGGNLVITFINAVGAQGARIAAAGVNMVINLVNNVANTIRSDSGRMNAAGRNLASAIIEGMVSGIAGGLGAVESEARSIASSALNAAKSFLGIHSPSTEFISVGEFSGQGMVVGFQNMESAVAKSAGSVASTALDTVKSTMSTIGDAISGGIDLNPTITPVLDLTQAQDGFNQLASLSKNQLISATATTNKATSISAENANAAAEAGLLTTAGGNTYNFTQNNTSPKALSTADIYRQTKNQISVLKGALSS